MNNDFYKLMADVYFKELDKISWDFNRTLRDRQEMVEEYGRAVLLEHLATFLMVLNRDNEDIPDKIETSRLEKVYAMQAPYKDMLMHFLKKDTLDLTKKDN
jgi:hypothetical protein